MEIRDRDNNSIGYIKNHVLCLNELKNKEFQEVKLIITEDKENYQWKSNKQATYQKKPLVCSLQTLIDSGEVKKKEEIKFCRINIAKEYQTCGVYIWLEEDEIIYIGKTVNFSKRVNEGYGRISPRNCYTGGQSTNCKMNHEIYKIFQRKGNVKLYIIPLNKSEYSKVEKELIEKIPTKYNKVLNNSSKKLCLHKNRK